MNRKLIDYLPPVMREAREIKLITGAEQGEVEELWDAAAGTLKEGFLDTQSIYGASRWERILDLFPKASDNLSVRNYRILAKLNERLPFTMRMLKERLNQMVRNEYQIVYEPDNYLLEIIITGQPLAELQIIREMLREMTPLNLIFIYAGRELFKFYIEIIYENRLTMIGSFYPRGNVAELFLDGSSCLDGEYLLNGYKNRQDTSPYYLDGKGYLDGRYSLDGLKEVYPLDFYPVRLLIRGELKQNIMPAEWLRLLSDILLPVRTGTVLQTESCFYPRYNVPLFRLDGTQFLDGTHFLDEMDQDFQKNFLDGESFLDGQYILNGYKDCNLFDFYPARLQILGELRQNCRLLEWLNLSAQVAFPVYTEPAVRVTGSRFYPRHNLPLLLLNGEAELNGKYLLNGRTDELSRLNLNGKAMLDGEVMLNGYGEDPDYEFYPAALRVLGDYKVQTNLFGQLFAHANVQVPISWDSRFNVNGSFCPELVYSAFLHLYGRIEQTTGLEGESRMISGVSAFFGNGLKCLDMQAEMYTEAEIDNTARISGEAKEQILTGKEHLTIEKDLWYLDGKQMLDGTVCLDADIYYVWL